MPAPEARTALLGSLLLAMWLAPTPLLWVVWRSWQTENMVEWLALTLFALVYPLTLHLTLNWAQTSPLLRYALWGLSLLTLVSAARLPSLTGTRLTLSSGVLLLTLLVLLPALRQAWLARRAPAHVMALGPVLGDGAFYVDQGGSRAIVNYHMRYRPLRYAVDFIGVDPSGRHSAGFLPSDPRRYAIFGAAVLAPCDAVVDVAVGTLPDLPVPQTDPRHLGGNHLILRGQLAGEEFRVLLGHLRHGSLKVQAGQRVRKGQIIAEVGNSGNTTEPHLHVGVFRGSPTTGEGLPFTLAGRFPVKGMVFRNGSGT